MLAERGSRRREAAHPEMNPEETLQLALCTQGLYTVHLFQRVRQLVLGHVYFKVH